MKKLLFSFAIMLTLTTAEAQEGNWKITSSKVPKDGSSYTGSVYVTKLQNVFELTWKTSVGDYTGVGIAKGNMLCVGYGINIDYGVVVYDLKADGSLQGIWATNQTGGMTGTEKVIGGKALNGTYQITGTNAGNNSPYQGTLTIKKTGNVYSLVWKTGNVSYNGVGILDGETLVVGWGFGAAFGVVNYHISGNTAQGTWTMGGGTSTGIENLSK